MTQFALDPCGVSCATGFAKSAVAVVSAPHVDLWDEFMAEIDCIKCTAVFGLFGLTFTSFAEIETIADESSFSSLPMERKHHISKKTKPSLFFAAKIALKAQLAY